jgi:hypothetical protein
MIAQHLINHSLRLIEVAAGGRLVDLCTVGSVCDGCAA